MLCQHWYEACPFLNSIRGSLGVREAGREEVGKLWSKYKTNEKFQLMKNNIKATYK